MLFRSTDGVFPGAEAQALSFRSEAYEDALQQDVQAQVAAGQKVRIPITLTGIDVDGDDDQLLGLGNKAPQLGRITEVGANYMI